MMLLEIIGVVELLGLGVAVAGGVAAAGEAAKPVATLIVLPQVVQAGFRARAAVTNWKLL